MEYAELITVALLLGLFIVLYFKQPTRMYSIVVRAVISDIEKNQNEISAKLYKRLPLKIREKVSADELITIITYIMSVILDTLKEQSNDNSKK